MTAIQDNNYMINDLATRREEFFPGVVTRWNQDGDRFYFFCDNDVVLEVSIVTDKILRFRYATEGEFEADFSYAIDDKFEKGYQFLEFKEKSDHFRITTDRLICTIAKERLSVKILDRSGTILLEDEKGFHWELNKEFGGDIVKMSKRVNSGEHYYGLGDKACNMNLRGKRFELWGTDTYGYGKNSDPLYKNIPFYIGLHQKIAYGIFFDNSFRSFFDFAHERSNVTSYWAQGGVMDFYFIYGPEFVEVIEEYTHLTGKPELPPMWALGYHQCKWSYYPEDLVRNICEGFRERQIPCDAIYLDIDYMDGFRCFTWNKDYFSDPKAMVADLEKDGFKTVVIIDPGIKVDRNYWVYREGLEKDYFCHRADGPLMKGSVWPGVCAFPDFTKQEVREWWKDLFRGLIAEDGIKGVWNDMNEPAVFEDGTFPNDVRHHYEGHPCSHRKAHNVYGMQMARATYMGVKKYMHPNRPFTITRSGYAGMQRYSSAWTGDNIASWEHMWLANIQCQRLSISGLSFVGSDIGGFIETPSGELYARWIALGIWHPFCRTHSSGDHGDQEPWSFGEDVALLAKKFIELRYMFLPYIYTTFWQYIQRGTPMLRPLVLLDQYDSETYLRMAEFGMGDDLLVCPITQPEADGRWLYLPKGNWFYYWTDDLCEGGAEIWAEAKLDRIPLYIKSGAVIPNYPVMQYVGQFVITELTLHVYHIEGEYESKMYDDGGDGYGYEEGLFNLVKWHTEGDNENLSIKQNIEGGAYKPTYDHYKIVFHGLPFKIKDAVVDGDQYQNFEPLEIDGKKVQVLPWVKRDFQQIEIR
jgi:alpha-glucosidase